MARLLLWMVVASTMWLNAKPYGYTYISKAELRGNTIDVYFNACTETEPCLVLLVKFPSWAEDGLTRSVHIDTLYLDFCSHYAYLRDAEKHLRGFPKLKSFGESITSFSARIVGHSYGPPEYGEVWLAGQTLEWHMERTRRSEVVSVGPLPEALITDIHAGRVYALGLTHGRSMGSPCKYAALTPIRIPSALSDAASSPWLCLGVLLPACLLLAWIIYRRQRRRGC